MLERARLQQRDRRRYHQRRALDKLAKQRVMLDSEAPAPPTPPIHQLFVSIPVPPRGQIAMGLLGYRIVS